MTDFIQSSTLLLLLINPFLVIVYLLDVMQKLDQRQFSRVLIRAGLIAGMVFCVFSLMGDILFSRIIQVEFGSFQIFGGIIFLLIGLQFFYHGPSAIEILRGESEHLAGAIAMPVLIGPGTISASVIIGKKHEPLFACLAVFLAVIISIIVIVIFPSLTIRTGSHSASVKLSTRYCPADRSHFSRTRYARSSGFPSNC